MLILKDQTTEELAALAAPLGGTPRVARQMQAHVLKRRAAELPETLDGLKRATWAAIRAAARVPHLELVEKAISPYDGFAKYLFRGDGPEVFEAVRIPLLHRPGDEKYVVCVSSQVGCAAGCAFCATGRLGFKRHLQTWEIVDQVVKIQADSEHPVRGIVFMGMGEPMLNYARVMRAAQIFTDPSGPAIDAKAITVSTVGVVPMIRRYTQEARPYRLIVSLTSAIDAKRDRLLPMNQNYPLATVFGALREYQAATGRRVPLAWTMMAGVNMDREELRALAALAKDLKILLDLIPVNDPTGRFRPPTDAERNAFLDLIREEVACPIVCRYSGGQDIHGACGMLAGRAMTAPDAPTRRPHPPRSCR
jgi:23S rRNA (adenine2503-C2)-methyltransferase